jgi:hypothetical protein
MWTPIGGGKKATVTLPEDCNFLIIDYIASALARRDFFQGT